MRLGGKGKPCPPAVTRPICHPAPSARVSSASSSVWAAWSLGPSPALLFAVVCRVTSSVHSVHTVRRLPVCPSAHPSMSAATVASNGHAPAARVLWQHPDPQSTEMHRFKNLVACKHGLSFGPETDAVRSLWRWSVDHLDQFWAEVWHYSGVRASKPYENV